MQPNSTENEHGQPPRGFKWFHYVPLEEALNKEEHGWVIEDFFENTPHGNYSILMRWTGEGEPI